MARLEKLLNIQPHELSFRFEVMKEASCTIRLSSNSSRNVAFKVMTTNPEKYSVKPNYGIILPGSSCDLEVKMQAQMQFPPNMQCKDKFLIKSVVAGPDNTIEKSRKLFNNKANAVEDYKLRVVYALPSHQQSSNVERSGQGSSQNVSILQERNLNGPQLLPVIWSWIFVATLLVTKMTKRLVSDSLEDWIVKTLLYACIHFFSVVFRRKNDKYDQESRVSVVG